MNRVNSEVVVIGTVYPAVIKYLDDYLNSLEEQTEQHFDLLLANDGIAGLDTLIEKRDLNSFNFLVDGSVSNNRRALINKVVEMGYRKIIFTDTDDTFEENRVEVMNNLLDRTPIVVNDLDITDKSGKVGINRYFSRRFKESNKITKSTLFSGNIMGLSNTAVRTEKLINSPALKEGESIAFDWYLWSSLLLDEKSACFTSDTSTKYRIYEQNIAGLPQPLDMKNTLKGVEVKFQHYALMSGLSDVYKKLADEFNEVKSKLKNDDWFIQYIEVLKKYAIEAPMWWENIKTPSEINFR